MGVNGSKSRGSITCPTCKLKLTNEIQLIEHYNSKHNTGNDETNVVEFKQGDRVLALWEISTWQYFTATIVRKVAETNYEIDWDDGDTTGRFVSVANLYRNITPDATKIQKNSHVLFRQGHYVALDTSTQQTGGTRWHEGVITDIHRDGGGYTFSGHHTRGESDGKSTSYSQYSYKFHRLTINDVRLSSLPFSLQPLQSTHMDSTDSGELVGPTAHIPRTTVDLNEESYLDVGHQVIAEWNGTGRYYSAMVADVLPGSKFLLDWYDNDSTGRSVHHYCINVDSVPRKEDLKKDSVVYFQKENQWHAGTITNVHTDATGQLLYDGEPLSKRFVQTLKDFTIEKLCSKIEINQDGSFNTVHVSMAAASPEWYGTSGLLGVGDRVLAMWVKTKWQYFPAKIVKVLPNLHYKIEWDDGDTTGLIVDCFKIAKDVIPNAGDIGVGSIVLFQQGGYSAGSSQLQGGVRWHQGIITNMRMNNIGEVLYDGCHTKGEADGKWVTYKHYSYQFGGVKREDLRVGPNMFDLVSQNSPARPSAPPLMLNTPPAYNESLEFPDRPPPYTSMATECTNSASYTQDTAPPAYSPPSLSNGGDDVCRVLKEIDPFVEMIENSLKNVTNEEMVDGDVFISYCWSNSSTAKESGHVTSFEGPSLADPRRIAKDIEKNELKVWLDVKCLSNTEALLQQHAKAIKTCRVFMPCISNQYSASTFCRMQFQYASGLPDKRIIPLIVGSGNNWKTSVIGLALERDKNKYQVVDFQSVDSENVYNKSVDQILSIVKK